MRWNRHPLEVTRERLASHYERYYAKLDTSERVAIENVMRAFEEIVDGAREVRE